MKNQVRNHKTIISDKKNMYVKFEAVPSPVFFDLHPIGKGVRRLFKTRVYWSSQNTDPNSQFDRLITTIMQIETSGLFFSGKSFKQEFKKFNNILGIISI